MRFRKKHKYKYINGCRGVISLFLCLVMTPILTLAAALVEFSRYQGSIEILQEAMNCSSLSTLSNYDKYIQDRFGLFTIKQDCDVKSTYNSTFVQNSKLLDKGITVNSTNAFGTLPLSDIKVLESQVADYSESTVLTEIMLDDLKLQDLLDKLNNLSSLKNVLDTINKLYNLATSIKDFINEIEDFSRYLSTIKTKTNELNKDINSFITVTANFYKKLNDNGFSISAENEDESLELIAKDYLDDIKDIYNKAKIVFDDTESLYTLIKDLPTLFNRVKTELSKVRQAYNAATKSTSNITQKIDNEEIADTSKDTSDQTLSIYRSVIKALEDGVEEAANCIKTSTVEAFKQAKNQFKNEIKEKLGFDDVKKRFNSDYYALPLSDDAKSNFKKILENFPTEWNDKTYDNLKTTLKDLFIPKNLTIDIDEIKDKLDDALSAAKNKFTDNMKQSLSKTITTLVAAVRGIFDLDVFYDGDLNGYLSDYCANALLSYTIDSDGDGRVDSQENPYVTMLEAITTLLSSCDEFVEKMMSFNLVGMITASAKLFKSVALTLQSLINLTSQTVEKIAELFGYVKNGDMQSLYKLLLVSGYLTHNLPNRTHKDSVITTIADTTTKVSLKGATLSGFKYSNIKTPVSNGVSGISNGISGLTSFLKNSTHGGSDSMFKGAELEYILAGTKSEIMNQTVSFMQLYLLRMLLDVSVIFTDKSVAAMAATANVASWAVYILLLIAEPLCDTVMLVNDGDVALVKNSCYLSPIGIPALISDLNKIAIKNKSVESGVNSLSQKIEGKLEQNTTMKYKSGGFMNLEYGNYMLLILMFSTTKNNMLVRLGDIIQLECNEYYKSSINFDIKRAYTNICTETDVTLNSFISIFQSNNSSAIIRNKFTNNKSY